MLYPRIKVAANRILAEKSAKKLAKEEKGKGKSDASAAVIHRDRRGFDYSGLKAIGVNAVAQYLSVESVEGEEYDLIYGKLKVAVFTQGSSYAELPFSINGWVKDFEANPQQKCDVYIFTRVNMETEEVSIGGWITRDRFYELAIHYDPKEKVGCSISHDAGYSILYGSLTPLQFLNDKMQMAPRDRTSDSRSLISKSRRGQ